MQKYPLFSLKKVLGFFLFVLAMNVTDCIPDAYAAPVISPLVQSEDALGQSLQKTMIWAPQEVPLASSFVAFRKRFSLPTAPRKATMHLFADVRYMVWINGQYVLRGPARFEPTGPEYDSMEVGRFLKAGENTIVVLVMSNASNGKMRRHAPGLTVDLEVDGKTALVTDQSWKWSDQTRYRNPNVDWGNTMDSIDARIEDGDWTQPSYDDSAWKTAASVAGEQWGPLSARRIPLLRDTVVPTQIAGSQALPVTLTAGQKLSFETDRLVQAYTVVDIDAEADSEISLDYCHVNYQARPGRQTYISSDTFGFSGGSITVKSGRVTILGWKLVERLYPFDIVGSFKSNDEMLNRLWAMCARSSQVLSEDAYVDCADRERTEWMDCDPPGFDITRTALSGTSDDGTKVYADARLLGVMLRRTALTVQPEGWVKAHTASDRFDIHAKMEDRACDWVEGARRYYESTGKTEVVREIWPVIVAQMNYFLERRTERGLFLGREWEVADNPLCYLTCEGAGLNAFVYKALVDAAYLGQVIGEKQQAAAFEKDANDLATAFNTVLWDEKNGTYFSAYVTDESKTRDQLQAQNATLTHTFTGYDLKTLEVENHLIAPSMLPALFALDQGIVPPSRRQRVENYLFANRNRNQAVQVMALYYLFRQMYEANNPTFDKEVLVTLRKKWKGMARWPWQTSWEHFGVGSKAHIYGMFPGYYLSAYVLGVRLDGPVWNKRLLIEPRLGDLTSAEGVVVTEHGPVPVSWKVETGKLTFHFEVPAGVKAALHVPQMGEKARLSLDGKGGRGKVQGRYFVVDVGAGLHQGSVTFTPTAPLPLPVPKPELPTALVTSKTSGDMEEFEEDVVKGSLIGIGQPTFLSVSGEHFSHDGGGTDADALRNGTTLNGTGGADTSNDGKTFRGYGDGDFITFNLDTTHHKAGYDITRIVTIAAHNDSRASQNYAVSIAFASDPLKFVSLISSASVACYGGASRLVLANPKGGILEGDTALKASGVASIRFEFHSGSVAEGAGSGFNVYREIGIVGMPTPARP
ncbi:hypothetical protein IAD21_05422 [Abditibacteriota bacterium]|nr:hypothetical protein IAD21_05422 [Abditibacteriota bacterium]